MYLSEETQFIIYAIVKFIAYSSWSAIGLYLFLQKQSFLRLSLKAIAFGSFRWCLGLFLGLSVVACVEGWHHCFSGAISDYLFLKPIESS